MVTTGVEVRVSGRLFKGSSVEVQRATNDAIREAIKLGEQRLAQTLRPRPAGVFLSVVQAQRGKASTGHYRRSLNTMFKDMHGRIDDGGVVYGPWLEVGRPGTRFRGYASFRRVGQWLEQQIPAIAEAHARRLVQRLNS